MTGRRVNWFVNSKASRSGADRVIVAKRFKSAFTGGDPKSESRQKLAEPVDSNPDVVGLRDCLTIPEPEFIEFSQKGLAAFLVT